MFILGCLLCSLLLMVVWLFVIHKNRIKRCVNMMNLRRRATMAPRGKGIQHMASRAGWDLNSTNSQVTNSQVSNSRQPQAVNFHHSQVANAPTSETFLEKLVTKLIRKDTIPAPRQFFRGLNIEEHLKNVMKYLNTMDIMDDASKCAVLFNTLDDNVAVELKAQPGFNSHEDDFTWHCMTLQKLYLGKQTDASPIKRLFNVKQKHDQSLKDFVTEIRVEAYKSLTNVSEHRKEHLILKAFLQGMRDRETAVALEAISPDSLDEAFKMAKGEIKINSETPNRQIEHLRAVIGRTPPAEQHQMDDVLLQIKEVQKQLSEIWLLLQNMGVREPPLREKRLYSDMAKGVGPIASQPTRLSGVPQRQRTQLEGHVVPRAPIRCYNCNRPGHIARFCTAPVNVINQSRRNTNRGINHDGYYKRQHVRQMIPTTNDSYSTSEEGIPADEDVEQRSDITKSCCVITSQGEEIEQASEIAESMEVVNKSLKKKPRTLFLSASKEERQVAHHWSEYIKGNRSKPKFISKYPHTVISESNSEPAKNKPVIVGKCASFKTKLFLDSGAEINVIDSALVKELIERKRAPIKFTQSKSVIKCANGSRMDVIGLALLPLEIGTVRAEQKFLVVNSVFPKVIIGIRTMKAMDICIDPRADCALVDGIRVPFISTIIPESIAPVKSGKGKWAF